MILETNRLYLREMRQEDFSSLCEILQNAEVMYAYEHAFSDDEVQEWLDKQLKRYKQDGHGLWAVILKETDKMIGQCGLTLQDYREKQVWEIGYLFRNAFWHHGYATEAAIACQEYAFRKHLTDEIFSIIRDNNVASQKVALRNDMEIRDSFTKHYHNIDMPHLVFSVRRPTET